MPLNDCPGCRHDEKRKQERAERHRQNRWLKEKETRSFDNHDRDRPDTIPDGSEESGTGEEGEEEFMDMVDAFMSRAYLYTKTMREVMAMDEEKGKQAGRVLAGVAGNPSMMGRMSEKKKKKKKKKDLKGKKAESGSSRTRVKGDRGGKIREQQPSGSSVMSGPSGIGGATGAPPEMTAATSRYSLDDTD